MGNCLGWSSSAAETTGSTDQHHPGGPPPKKQKIELIDGQKYVTADVVRYRNEASDYHDKVVSCAKGSQDAYQKGDKQKAKTLSEEKKQWQTKQDDANRRAVQLIVQPQKWQSSGELDLHGLHVDEALDVTEDFLAYWSKKANSRETVLIITGAGHHSDGHKAVIRPQVASLLKKKHLQYESTHKDGAYEVHLRPSQ
jgi:DNA-nicking Smr family endonuclease